MNDVKYLYFNARTAWTAEFEFGIVTAARLMQALRVVCDVKPKPLYRDVYFTYLLTYNLASCLLTHRNAPLHHSRPSLNKLETMNGERIELYYGGLLASKGKMLINYAHIITQKCADNYNYMHIITNYLHIVTKHFLHLLVITYF